MGSQPTAFEAIRGVPLFHSISDEGIETLAGIAHEIQASSGELLIQEGAQGDSMFVIAEGRVVVTKRGNHGSDERIVSLGPGNHVGLNALVEAAPRSANVLAGDKGAILYEIRFDALESLLKTDVALAALFWRAAAKGLSRHLRRATTDAVVLRALIRAQQE